MKLNLSAITFLFIALLFQQQAIASNIKTYRNNQLGFEISYSNNWVQSKRPDNSPFFIQRKSADEPGTIGIKVANLTGDKDKFMRGIKQNPEIMIKKYKQRFPDAELIKSEDTYLGGFPAYYVKASYSIKNLNFEIKVISLQIFCIRDNKIYLVSFETPQNIFNKTFVEFQAIMATFNYR